MDDQELTAEIRKHCRETDGKQALSCPRAHVLAEDLGVSLRRIGRICDAEQIKITNCQLGCFGKSHG